MRSRVSAGLVLWRRGPVGIEVLLGHPGGPLFSGRDAGYWSIPKGEVEAAERADGEAGLAAVARREFAEETGHPVPDGPLLPLGSIVQKGGKEVYAWAAEGDLDPAAAHSNLFTMPWPPGSGRLASFPELDRVAWFGLQEARERVKSTQIPLLDRLEAALA
jgi:predicted NUDIX family NTP pyrophosphohydrolase